MALTCACGGDPEPLEPCHTAAAGVDNPRTLDEAVERLNSLPSPVTIPCFLASLERPLEVVATRSTTSAQPAYDETAPRLFILLDGLELAVVPEGHGALLLEFGEEVSPQHTVKGELLMPVTAPIAHSAPLLKILRESGKPGTQCGGCHQEETLDRTVNDVPGYRSVAYKPHFSLDVPLYDVALFHDQCDAQQTPYHCEMLHALFDFGQVVEGAFPEAMKTIGE